MSSEGDTVTSKGAGPAALEGVLRLRVISSGAVFVLPPRGELDIGRDPECFIRLDDPSVSRRHAVLRIGDATELRDLDSKNGTFVGYERLEPDAWEELERGLVVFFGDVGTTLERHSQSSPSSTQIGGPIWGSGLQATREAAERVARDSITVLILGETGVGKEVVAEHLHERSGRRGPFVRLHCAAIAESLFEAELFGHERGAFTDAGQARPGIFETAEGGTLLVDEVGELPAAMQVKLLRVLEDKRVRRVEGRSDKAVDVRIVAATNRDLEV
ncbi:MAG: sigma 54-interacting transcriptional regulator, partial [Myxococcota bacterium]